MDVLKSITATFLAVVLLLVYAPVFAAPGTGIRAEDHEIKAAYIYNFTKFVKWPPAAFVNAAEPLRVCLVDNSELGEALEAIVKKSKGRQIRVVSATNITEADKCHLVFIGEATDATHTKKILNSVARQPVLTVGETTTFVRQGGIIGFTTSGNKLTFEINPATAKRNGLEISSKMLSLARIVRDQP